MDAASLQEWHATLEARLKGTPGFQGVFMADALRGVQVPQGAGSLIACIPPRKPGRDGRPPRYVAILWAVEPDPRFAVLIVNPRGFGTTGDDDYPAVVALNDFAVALRRAKNIEGFPFDLPEEGAPSPDAEAYKMGVHARVLPTHFEEMRHDPWGEEDEGAARWDSCLKADQYLSELSSLFCVQEVLAFASVDTGEAPAASSIGFTHPVTGDWRVCRRNAEAVQKEVGISARVQPNPPPQQ